MKKIILLTLIFTLLGSTNIHAETNLIFTDISNHWAKNQIENLSSLGIVSGKGNGIFAPQDNVTVAEFIKLTVSLLNKNIEPYKNQFWAQAYIDEAIRLEIIKTQDFKDYNKFLTREEMSYIALNTSKKLYTLNDIKTIDNPQAVISDYSKIEEKYVNSVLNSYSLKLMSGKPNGIFDPKGNLTRAESCIVIYNIINLNKGTNASFDFIDTVTKELIQLKDLKNINNRPLSEITDILNYIKVSGLNCEYTYNKDTKILNATIENKLSLEVDLNPSENIYNEIIKIKFNEIDSMDYINTLSKGQIEVLEYTLKKLYPKLYDEVFSELAAMAIYLISEIIYEYPVLDTGTFGMDTQDGRLYSIKASNLNFGSWSTVGKGTIIIGVTDIIE